MHKQQHPLAIIHRHNGFTLMEMMVVVSIIAILATMSVPIFTNKIIIAQMTEAFEMLDAIKPPIKTYYLNYGTFPDTNMDVSLPGPEYLIGNYVEQVKIQKGAVQIYFGNKAHSAINGKILSIRPQVVIDSPDSPISWACGNSKPPKGMKAEGDNMTNIELRYLPYNCR